MGLGHSKDIPEWVVKHGYLIHNVVGKKYCVLTDEDLMFFASKKHAFTDFDNPECKLPLYLVVVSDNKEKATFHIKTPDRIMSFKTKQHDKFEWMTEINTITKSKKFVEHRKNVYRDSNKWTVHIHVMEARELEEAGSSSSISVHIEKQQDDDPSMYLCKYNDEKMIRVTESLSGSNPIWGDAISFAAVDEEDSIVFNLLKPNKKVSGSVTVKMSTLDLGGDVANQNPLSMDFVSTDSVQFLHHEWEKEASEYKGDSDIEEPIRKLSDSEEYEEVDEEEEEDEDEDLPSLPTASDHSLSVDPDLPPMPSSDEDVMSPPGDDSNSSEFDNPEALNNSNSSDDEIDDALLKSFQVASVEHVPSSPKLLEAKESSVNSESSRSRDKTPLQPSRNFGRIEGMDTFDENNEQEILELYDERDIDIENRALGIHRWIEIRNDKNKFKGFLHVCIRAVPSYELTDLSMETTDFREKQTSYLAPSNNFLDDRMFNKPLRIYVGTWNVGNAAPSEDLRPWIPPNDYDLIAIGGQECKYEPRKGFSTCREDWVHTLAAVIGDEFELLDFVGLLQIRLAVFVRRKLLPEISNVNKDKEATGIGHVYGNKGGTILNLYVRNTSICFVNTHLAAHQDMTSRRNNDIKEVVKNAKNGCKISDLANYFDYTFWFGDLNYRIESKEQGKHRKPPIEVYSKFVQLIKDKNYEALYENDQLKYEMDNLRIFAGYREGNYNFEPTFKVKRHETLTYNKQRSPAYCDRILWKAKAGRPIVQIVLDNALEVDSSDHKPVYSVFVINTFYYTHSNDLRWSNCRIKLYDFKLKILTDKDGNNCLYKLSSQVFSEYSVIIGSNEFNENGMTRWINLTISNIERLKQYAINVEVLQYDKAVIGYGTISLANILFTPKESIQPYPFKTIISKGTVGHGRLYGTVNFEWTPTTARRYQQAKYLNLQ